MMPGAFALALLTTAIVNAATDADLADIREQIRQMKESYEARIQALEQKLKEAQAKFDSATPAAAAPPTAPAPVTAVAAPSPSSGISAFNPAISAVLQGV